MTDLYIDIPIGLLGDTIVCATAARYYIKLHNSKDVNIYDNFGIARMSELGQYCYCPTYRSGQTVEKDKLTEIVNFGKGRPTNLLQHLIDNALMGFVDDPSLVPIEEKNYIKYILKRTNPFDIIDKKHVIVNCSYTDNKRKLTNDVMTDIIDFLVKSDLKPVFIGATKNNSNANHYYTYDIDYTKGINLIDKLSLEHVLMLLSKANLFISVDGGLVHVAGMTDISILSFSAIAYPLYIAPIRHGEIGWNYKCVVPDIECRYCTLRDSFKNDCNHVTEDAPCIKSIKSEQFINYLEEYVKYTKEN